MAQKEEDQSIQINALLSDFNTRLRDIEEKSRIVKERTMLLSQNLISLKEDIDSEMSTIKKDQFAIKKDQEKIKNMMENLLSETDKFARKDEMIIIERMLKTFQPLEFARIKDVEEMIRGKNAQKEEKQNIKTPKTTQ